MDEQLEHVAATTGLAGLATERHHIKTRRLAKRNDVLLQLWDLAGWHTALLQKLRQDARERADAGGEEARGETGVGARGARNLFSLTRVAMALCRLWIGGARQRTEAKDHRLSLTGKHTSYAYTTATLAPTSAPKASFTYLYPLRKTLVAGASASGASNPLVAHNPTPRNSGLWSRSGHLGKRFSMAAALGMTWKGL